MKKLSAVSASALSKKISVSAIFETIVREDRELINFRDENVHEWASSQLAGYLGEIVSPRTKNLREYITAGLDALDLIADSVESRLENIHDSLVDNKFSPSSISLKRKWLKAFGLASVKVKREEIALLLAEDWLQTRGFDE
jgi:hypothetical protein